MNKEFCIIVNGKEYDLRKVTDWESENNDFNDDEITLYFDDQPSLTFSKSKDLDAGDVLLDQFIDCI
ncbi:hypothetical protein CAL7716_053330 [Calothrix sp. PCC 7716]|nr:hypothetical protein CAL7716_053330 [Calothrix sp. PCC 7716]